MKRVAAIFIIICTLLCSTSCYGTKEEAQSSASRVELILEHPECIYSEDLCNEVSASATELIARILLRQKELILTDNDRAKLAQSIKDKLLPLAMDVPVYPSELRDLCKTADELMLSDLTNIELLGGFYSRAYEIIGDVRTEKLCYNSLKFYLEYSLEKTENYYTQTQYPWYAEDIETAKQQLSLLCDDIGEQNFSTMIAPFVITANILFSGYEIYDENINAFSNKDISLLINEYLYELDERGINDDQWQKAWTLFELFEFEKLFDHDTLLTFAIEALREDKLFSYVGGFTHNILKLAASACESADITEQIKSDFLELDARLRISFPKAHATLSAIERAGKLEDFNSFLQTYTPKDAQSLLDALSSDASTDSRELYISYLLSISPELAYIVSYTSQNEVIK